MQKTVSAVFRHECHLKLSARSPTALGANEFHTSCEFESGRPHRRHLLTSLSICPH